MAARVSVLVVVSDLDGFRRLLASLDRQTLPASEFEVLAADGGLNAGAALLHRLADHRPNVHVVEGGATPWPALVATSTGELVVPLHDTDTLYERALARLDEEGRSADVVLGKSVRPGARASSLDLMTRDHAVDTVGLDPRSAEGLAVAMTRALAEKAADGAADAAGLRSGAAAEAGSIRAVATLLCLRAAPTSDPLPRGSNPSVVRATFVDDQLVLTGDLGARCSLRSLETGVEWPLEADLEDRARRRIDVHTAALGGRLEPGRWVVETTDGDEPPVGARLQGHAPGSALVGETLVVVKAKDGGRLVIDVGATHKDPFRPVDLGEASIVEDAAGTLLRMPLEVAYAGGPVVLPATLYLGDFPLHASLAAADGQVALECLLSGVPGRSPLKLAVAGSPSHPLRLELVIANTGEMSLSRPPAKKRAGDLLQKQAKPRPTSLRRLADRIPGRSRRS